MIGLLFTELSRVCLTNTLLLFLTRYLVVGWCSLAPPATASLLGPSWLAGGSLAPAVNIGGRGAAAVSTAV